MPHPKGTIRVDLEKEGDDGLTGTVTLPKGLSGTFEWEGETTSITGGTQQVEF
jgi:hypothetical protein